MASEQSITNPHLYPDDRELEPDHERPNPADVTPEPISDHGEDVFDYYARIYRLFNFDEPDADWDPDTAANALG